LDYWSLSQKLLDSGAGAQNLVSGSTALVFNRVVQTIEWTKPFWSRSQKRLDVGAGAGAKNLGA